MTRSGTASPSFGSFFSSADFEKFVEHRLERSGATTQKDVDDWQKLLREIMRPALKGFLSELKAAGRLEPIPGSEGRSARFMSAWNGIVTEDAAYQNEPKWLWDSVTDKLAHSLIFGAAYNAAKLVRDGGDKLAVCRKAFDDLIVKVNKGDLGWHELGDDECRITGDRLHTEIEEWKVRQGTIDRGKIVPMKPVNIPAIVEMDFEVKTGNLLIADWFRIKEFTDLANEGEYERPGINSERGCVVATEHYLRNLGFISVFVGNSMPSIIDVDNALAFGWVDEDYDEEVEEDPTKDIKIRGSVCTDLWWATVIEREQLVSLVSSKIGQEAAEQAVARYLDENKHNFTEVKLEPGTYHLYFAGDPEKFGEKFSSPDLKLHDRIEPMFVLSKNRLELVDKPDAAGSLRL